MTYIPNCSFFKHFTLFTDMYLNAVNVLNQYSRKKEVH